MVTKRLPVNLENINFYDGQRITEEEMQDEQNRNVGIDAATVANFFGSGVVKNVQLPKVILDTNDLNAQQQNLLDGDSFDGSNIYIGTTLPTVSDQINGVQLSVTLSNVNLDGIAFTRVLIIGDEFGDNLIHDELIFNYNGTKITRGRYKSIRAIIFNDFAGNLNGSNSWAYQDSNLVGNCIIKEVASLEVSIDPIVISQTNQPSQFFYNFYPATGITIEELLQNSIGADKSFDDLNISLDSKDQRELVANDVTTRIGQKFLAKGSNIQKISILLSVKYDITNLYNWSGSVVMNIHALQTDVSCPVTPIPDNAIDFDPNPAIIAQLSLDINDLKKQGIVLNGDPQIVDFIFTSSSISNPISSPIEKDKYYVFTIGRSGDTHTGILLIEEADNRIDNSYMVYFNGVEWTNITDSDMWFSIKGDYVKISDGLGYKDGVGIEVLKIAKNETNIEVPYVEGLYPFYTSAHNLYNYVLLEKGNNYTHPEQDQRTGNLIYSRVSPTPNISLIGISSLNNLIISDPNPILLASVYDTNPRGNPAIITGTTEKIGLAFGNTFNILNPDADIRNNNLVGSILSPNSVTNFSYRIIKSELIQDSYGDVDGDGTITSNDLSLAISYNGYSLSNPAIQQFIANGYLDIINFLRADVNGDGIVDSSDITLIQNYVNKITPSAPVGNKFYRMELTVEKLISPFTSVEMQVSDSTLVTVPYSSLDWKIEYFSTWFEDLLKINDMRRFISTTLIDNTDLKGRSDFYIPGNLILDGFIIDGNSDGLLYSLDFEMTHLSLDIPVVDSYGDPTLLDGYSGILLFDNFVAESYDGLTASGFPAMKYFDKSYVQIGDFVDGKVKITAALQSVANEYSGGTINDIVGLYYDPTTSLLLLYIKDQYDDNHGNTLTPISTKVLVSVYLKKGGFANTTREITQVQMRVLLNI